MRVHTMTQDRAGRTRKGGVHGEGGTLSPAKRVVQQHTACPNPADDKKTVMRRPAPTLANIVGNRFRQGFVQSLRKLCSYSVTYPERREGNRKKKRVDCAEC